MSTTQTSPRFPRVRRHAAALAVAALAGTLLAGVNAQPASATPPGIPPKATAQSQLTP